MLRFGDVVEVDLVKARYRVYFPVDDVISFPLPHVAFSVDGATPHLPISKGTQVACLVDGMEGVILPHLNKHQCCHLCGRHLKNNTQMILLFNVTSTLVHRQQVNIQY